MNAKIVRGNEAPLAITTCLLSTTCTHTMKRRLVFKSFDLPVALEGQEAKDKGDKVVADMVEDDSWVGVMILCHLLCVVCVYCMWKRG